MSCANKHTLIQYLIMKKKRRGNKSRLIYSDLIIWGMKLSSVNPTEAGHHASTCTLRESRAHTHGGRWGKNERTEAKETTEVMKHS